MPFMALGKAQGQAQGPLRALVGLVFIGANFGAFLRVSNIADSRLRTLVVSRDLCHASRSGIGNC
jgi:hypothetical protein